MQRMVADLAINRQLNIMMKGSVFPLVPTATDAYYMSNSVPDVTTHSINAALVNVLSCI